MTSGSECELDKMNYRCVGGAGSGLDCYNKVLLGKRLVVELVLTVECGVGGDGDDGAAARASPRLLPPCQRHSVCYIVHAGSDDAPGRSVKFGCSMRIR